MVPSGSVENTDHENMTLNDQTSVLQYTPKARTENVKKLNIW